MHAIEQDLVSIVRFAAVTRLVDDNEVFFEFASWLNEQLVARGVPAAALTAGLEVLAPLVDVVEAQRGELIRAGAVAVG